jgi:hypothetical protein
VQRLATITCNGMLCEVLSIDVLANEVELLEIDCTYEQPAYGTVYFQQVTFIDDEQIPPVGDEDYV